MARNPVLVAFSRLEDWVSFFIGRLVLIGAKIRNEKSGRLGERLGSVRV